MRSIGLGKVLIHKPVAANLLSYLSLVDYYNLHQVIALSFDFPTPFQVCQEEVLRRLHLRVSDRIVDVIAFYLFEVTGANRVFLTGGFLLDVLQGEPPRGKEQDIDLVIVASDPTKHPLYQYICNDNNVELPERYATHWALTIHLPSRKDGWKVQLINVPNERDYLRTFDFSFCANLLGQSGLFISDSRALTQRSASVRTIYYARDITECPAIMYGDLRNAMQRIQKYRARGYDIQVVHDASPDDILKFFPGPVYPNKEVAIDPECALTFDPFAECCKCRPGYYHMRRDRGCEWCKAYLRLNDEVRRVQIRARILFEWNATWQQFLDTPDDTNLVTLPYK